MLIYNKRVFTFNFNYNNEIYEVNYIKEFNNIDGLETYFKVQGNINHLKEVEEILNENELEISELLENNLELEEIKFEDLGV